MPPPPGRCPWCPTGAARVATRGKRASERSERASRPALSPPPFCRSSSACPSSRVCVSSSTLPLPAGVLDLGAAPPALRRSVPGRGHDLASPPSHCQQDAGVPGRMQPARCCTPARPGFTKSLDLPREGYSGISSEFGRLVEVATACFLGPGFEPEKGFARHAHFRVSGREQRAREQVGPASKSGLEQVGRASTRASASGASPQFCCARG